MIDFIQVSTSWTVLSENVKKQHILHAQFRFPNLDGKKSNRNKPKLRWKVTINTSSWNLCESWLKESICFIEGEIRPKRHFLHLD